MYFLIGIGHPAAELLFLRVLGKGIHAFPEGKPCYFVISLLSFHFRIVQASSIYTWRRPSLHSPRFKAKFNQLFSNAVGRLFSCSSPSKIFLSNVYQTI